MEINAKAVININHRVFARNLLQNCYTFSAISLIASLAGGAQKSSMTNTCMNCPTKIHKEI